MSPMSTKLALVLLAVGLVVPVALGLAWWRATSGRRGRRALGTVAVALAALAFGGAIGGLVVSFGL